MNDPATRGHPLHLARLDFAALVAVVNGTVEEERHRFEPCMRVRPTHRAVADIEMVIGEHDEGIAAGKVVGRHDLCRQVSGTDESRREGRNGEDTRDTALQPTTDITVFHTSPPPQLTST